MIANLTIPKLAALAQSANSFFQAEYRSLKRKQFEPPSLIIAGGAVRDTLNKRPVKDIDIFVYCDEDKVWERAQQIFAESLYGEADPQYEEGYGEGFQLTDIPTGLHMHPIQLVRIGDSPIDHLEETFDFGLSKCYIDAGGNLHCTREYWRDYFDQKIRYVGDKNGRKPDAYQIESSRKRLARLKEKYPSWRFEYPSFLNPDTEPDKLTVHDHLILF